jgi:uncharacterized protein YndB with AHSA1/START domain
MTTPVVHASFSIDRIYPVEPARVFQAFADHDMKRRWFVEGEGFEVHSYSSDFRVGGREESRFQFLGNDQVPPTPMGNDTVYLDIVPNERIVIAYSMTLAGRPFSASLATMEFEPVTEGTRLVYTEQAAFLEGSDGPELREAGCRQLLESLARELQGQRV